jgi:Asp-tRNA(Asn)/Glu-tRNA(Gln) amidotransferase A subunit family amidase
MKSSAAIFTFIALFIAFFSLFVKRDSTFSGKLNLGIGEYDIVAIEAPIASGFLLDAMSFLFSKSLVGPSIRRTILNTNGALYLRELASQIKLPGMTYPFQRPTKIQQFDSDSLSRLVDPFHNISSIIEDNFEEKYFIPRSVLDYASNYKKGVLPSEIMKNTLTTVKQWESTGFNIFSSIIEDDVMKQAYESDVRHKNRKPLSVFDGVPIAFKDCVDLKGHFVYYGRNPSNINDKYTAAKEDEVMVHRLRSLGAIMFGLTIMHEGGVSNLGYNTFFKGPYNPYSRNIYSGGSSSGSAVAVATGIVPVAIGFDGGGSIRVPAAFSGVHGLAATFSRIAFKDAIHSTMVKVGPLAATARDAALVYSVIAEEQKGSFYSNFHTPTGLPPVHTTGFDDINNLTDVRIGMFVDWFKDSDDEVKTRCNEVVEFLVSRGATIVPIKIPHMKLLSTAHALRITTEFSSSWDFIYTKPQDGLEPNTRISLSLGNSVTGVEILAINKIRAWCFEYVTKNLFEELKLSIIVTPTVGSVAPVLNEYVKTRGESNSALTVKVMKFVFLANFLGLPAYSVPVGFTDKNNVEEKNVGKENKKIEKKVQLPIGFQLIGDHFKEHILLRIANSIEEGFTKKKFQKKNPPFPLFYFDPFRK